MAHDCAKDYQTSAARPREGAVNYSHACCPLHPRPRCLSRCRFCGHGAKRFRERPVVGLWPASGKYAAAAGDNSGSRAECRARAQPDTSLEAHPRQHAGIHAARSFATSSTSADWFPGDHPPMPDVVVHGRAPDVRGCAMCHMPNGKGRPENAPIAGLPYAYVVQQLTGLQERSAHERRPAQDEHRADDRGGEGDDRRRDQGGRDLLRRR